ncbi:MAG: MerR family transcriptional regulator [Proteobacteria bacterium]|nr:MerR family transcriptional regulator [Pseudomonadota bacterium]NIS67694.1 MerR family transcriptional regulator [Pseudomonadota bacterium]
MLTILYSYCMKPKQIHPIRYVARQTGLTPHVIRAWERRYKAIAPGRSPTNRRLYSEANIERLGLLKNAVMVGHSIGQLAGLTNDEIRKILGRGEGGYESPSPTSTPTFHIASPLFFVEASVSALLDLDSGALERLLTRAEITLSKFSLIDQVIVPLVQKLDELWSSGSLKIVHEHMASSVIRTFLGDILRFCEIPPTASPIIMTTPVGQLHELGALIAAVAAASEGWRSIYLGPNLPAEEITNGVEQTQATVVGLSLVYPPDDPRVLREIKTLRRCLPERVVLIVGGRAAEAYSKALEAIGAIHVQDIPSFRRRLESLRSPELV